MTPEEIYDAPARCDLGSLILSGLNKTLSFNCFGENRGGNLFILVIKCPTRVNYWKHNFRWDTPLLRTVHGNGASFDGEFSFKAFELSLSVSASKGAPWGAFSVGRFKIMQIVCYKHPRTEILGSFVTKEKKVVCWYGISLVGSLSSPFYFEVSRQARRTPMSTF